LVFVDSGIGGWWLQMNVNDLTESGVAGIGLAHE
jgi:hypothetical protein